MLLLMVLYRVPGDATPWGEYLTVWPPVLWWIPAALAAVPLAWRGARGPTAFVIASVIAFGLAHVEWRSLLRFGEGPPGSIRVVTWNLGGGYASLREVTDALAELEPDLVLLQETPDGPDVFEGLLTAHFVGWKWIDGGDCGALTRWPATVLETRQVGPWDKPQLLSVALPDGGSLLVANVRLELPSLELLPLSGRARQRLRNGNASRTAQYPELARLIGERRAERDDAGVVLGGDFNTVLTARSLDPLRRDLLDVWTVAGRGWGGTTTRDFPVARIDGFLVGGGLRATRARVVDMGMSDHRAVVADLELAPTDGR
jgi:endonuclease/exonuclease/phosphatase (EEP) superfamily protein YafD